MSQIITVIPFKNHCWIRPKSKTALLSDTPLQKQHQHTCNTGRRRYQSVSGLSYSGTEIDVDYVTTEDSQEGGREGAGFEKRAGAGVRLGCFLFVLWVEHFNTSMLHYRDRLKSWYLVWWNLFLLAKHGRAGTNFTKPHTKTLDDLCTFTSDFVHVSQIVQSREKMFVRGCEIYCPGLA